MIKIITQGGIVMYPLILCSIISLAVIIERSIFWIFIKKNRNKALSNEILDLFLEKNWDAIKEKTKNTKDYVIKVLISGILHRKFSISKAMEAAAAQEIKKMQKYMSIIDTMITAAPLLGILGTVIGIITSFDALGSAGIEHPQAVTAGIAQALLTTAAGLSIAIFSVFPYNFFNSRIKDAVEEIEKYASNLEIVWEMAS
jgi:biopolymer transport protein ExbB